MKGLVLSIFLIGCIWLTGCEIQSEITKKSLEKYQPTPTPQKIVVVEEPIDPGDILRADVSAEGEPLGLNKDTDNSKLNCSKYNRVMINGDDHKVEIKGACRQIMVNGSGNQVVTEAASEIITNGTGNTVDYLKYVNGNKPIITDNSHGSNAISKVSSVNPAQTKR